MVDTVFNISIVILAIMDLYFYIKNRKIIKLQEETITEQQELINEQREVIKELIKEKGIPLQ